jgi:TDG/mug DNA glycosylase family protein
MTLDNLRPGRAGRSVGTLRDVIRPGVRVLFVGINPGLRSAAVGHHFAGYSNRFWKLLFESRLVSEPLDWRDDRRLPEWGFGITNLVGRATAGISELASSDFKNGRRVLVAKIHRFQPEIVALVGVTLFRSLFPTADFPGLGLQMERLDSTRVFVLPNPSGRNAHVSYREMLAAFCALRAALG